MNIEIFSRRNLIGQKRWFFRVRSSNLEIVAQSEGYSRHIDARRTAESMQQYLGTGQITDEGEEAALRDEGDAL